MQCTVPKGRLPNRMLEPFGGLERVKVFEAAGKWLGNDSLRTQAQSSADFEVMIFAIQFNRGSNE